MTRKALTLLVLALLALPSLLLVGCDNGDSAPAEQDDDKTAPVISGVVVAHITETTAIISWTTDEPATSHVEYGTSDSYGQFSTLTTDLGTSHSVTLEGLEADTLYHFRARSGNEATSANDTFTTLDTTPPVISGVVISDITTTSAVVSWTTDEDSTSQVEHGTSESYGQASALNSDLATSHVISLSDLTAGTSYHFVAKSKDKYDNPVTSTDYSFTTPAAPASELTVHFIDVGQGDSILIDLGETEVLIDGGKQSPGVVAYLSDFVDGPLEAMVATHPHADHIGGLTAVLNAYDVEQIWRNGDTSTSQTYASFTAAVQAEGAQVYEARRGDEITAGDLTFTVLHPTGTSGSTNNNSIVLSLSYGEIDFVFTGDAEQEAEGSMLTAGVVPDVEILKVGHHGSNTASSSAFLQALQPEVAIYMCKTGNSYGHPHAETLSALQDIEAQAYGIDVNGTIVVTTDGVTYTVEL